MGKAKITQEIADAIRAEHARGTRRAEQAARYGVSLSSIEKIVAGKNSTAIAGVANWKTYRNVPLCGRWGACLPGQNCVEGRVFDACS